MRWLGALVIGVVLAVVTAPDAARAHGVVLLTVHGDGRGSVWVSATWQDGHPVTEPVVATVTASAADGRRVGPEPLGAFPGGARYRDTLAPGVWTVLAEAVGPGLGRCEAVLRVEPASVSAAGQRIRCGEPQAPAAAAASVASAASVGGGGGAGRTLVALIAAAVAGIALTVGLHRRRRR